MDNFATKGPVNVGDALAALALVRALLKTLQAKNVIADGDLNSIVADALGQVGSIVNCRKALNVWNVLNDWNERLPIEVTR